MIGRLDRDEDEERKCYDIRYGKKFKSFRSGLEDGKHDAKAGPKLDKRTANPFPLPTEVYELLRKRARWQMGYDAGWEIIKAKRQEKKKKK